MPAQRRMHDQYQIQKGGAGLRFDHVQVLAPNVSEASRFYLDLGFRISDYFVDQEHDTNPLGIFMYRKNNPHDIVFLTRPGPVFHHFAYIVADSTFLFRALDTAGNIGFASSLERGPARHGEGHALYVYFRDPDGHRVEIMTPPIQMGDAEDVPMRWHRGNRHSWEFPAPKSWLYEATKFEGLPVQGHKVGHGLRNLEDFLASKVLRKPE
jgi:catechol 2,3-dioxygenase